MSHPADISGAPAARQPTPGLVAERAYFELRDRIVTLRLPPGACLREDELMAELDLGRTPLREAIKRLTLEHLVDVRPRRGTYVTDVHAADIAQITEVRAPLEGHAAQLAAQRMDDALRAEAHGLVDALEALEPADGEALMRADERVHRFAWRAAGNGYLAATLEGYYALSLRVWYLVLDRVPGLSATVHDEHRLLEALLAGDGDAAGERMREHVLAFEADVARALGAEPA
ncbi:MAG: GntR family transcriptional regulator [Actinomycetota bacterium]|nr:GntR family transcriptional regulator [Actinomycetota bacterium]